MSEEAAQSTAAAADTGPMPLVQVPRPYATPDFATILGAVFALGLIAAAILMSDSHASFFNLPSVIIVLFGTMAATSIAFTPRDLGTAGHVIIKSIARKKYNAKAMATALMDLATAARKKGVLSLMNYENELKKEPFLHRSMQLVIDGYQAQEVIAVLDQEIIALKDRHKRAASIARRASEIAPAMGLIGTLVGLVQMLADLSNPESIGPAMAVALLTTFYGAILGTILMAPLAAKLEKNSEDEAMIKTLIMTACASIANQENPRRLEMLLNSALPPKDQIQYFD